MTREVALRLNVFNPYTYTLETIIQAGRSNIQVLSVPVRTNRTCGPHAWSRAAGYHVVRSVATIVRIFATYQPMLFFWLIGARVLDRRTDRSGRFLVLLADGDGSGHVQSVIFGGTCMILASCCSSWASSPI